MTPRELAGTALLVRRALRRDRVLLAIWVPVAAATVYASAAATASLYPNLADRVGAVRAINANQAVVALYGPILDERSLGEPEGRERIKVVERHDMLKASEPNRTH